MALIALVTADKVEIVGIPVEQHTLPSAEAITAGAPVRIDTSSGKFTNANGTVAGEARAYGIATKTVAAGEPVTAVRRGVLDGFNLDAQAYDAAIYVADTDGRLGDAAGTVSVIAGRVLPATSNRISQGYDKVLLVNLNS